MTFADQGTSDLYNGLKTKAARSVLPSSLRAVAERKLDYLEAAMELSDLRSPPGNRLEKLAGDRGGQFSIRINEQYRICFAWIDGEATEVEIVDYH